MLSNLIDRMKLPFRKDKELYLSLRKIIGFYPHDISYYKQTTDEFYVIEVETAGQPDMDLFYTTGGEMIKAIPSASVPDILPTTVISR